nr:MAG TPA: Myoactive tetradecapeptides family [Caudoviricetes sp.]
MIPRQPPQTSDKNASSSPSNQPFQKSYCLHVQSTYDIISHGFCVHQCVHIL